MATAITETPQDITGDFDLCVSGVPDNASLSRWAVLQKALGTGGTNHITLKSFGGQEHFFVKNTGTNSFRLLEDIDGVAVEFEQ
jgi:hypothetical protein